MSLTLSFAERKQLRFSDLLNNSDSSIDNNVAWLSKEREAAYTRFCNAPLPNRKVEHWKYNDLNFLTQRDYKLPYSSASADQSLSKPVRAKIPLDNAIELDFVDGVLISDLNELELPEGLQIINFANANGEQQQLVKTHFKKQVDSKNLFTDLNDAICSDGVLIRVSANNIINTPIYLRYFSNGTNKATVTSNRVIIELAKASSLRVIEQFESDASNQAQLSLQQTSVVLGDNSQLKHCRLNLEDQSALQVSSVRISLAKNAELNGFYLGLGSQLNRTDIDVAHKDQYALAKLTGIYLPSNKQAIDYHTNIEHQQPNCKTREVFRGIIADQASATFNGKIHIFRDAQKSDAQLNNKNLLLTNQAEVNTKPELEIYADDVTCAHGATVAQLDNKSLYYMQSRGINPEKARKILSFAFVRELLCNLEDDAIEGFLSSKFSGYLSRIS